MHAYTTHRDWLSYYANRALLNGGRLSCFLEGSKSGLLIVRAHCSDDLPVLMEMELAQL